MKNKKNLIIICVISIVILLIVGLLILFLNKNDDSIIITENGGTSSRWEYEIEDKTIVEFDKTNIISSSNNEGGEIKTEYIFKGLKEGKTTIKFNHYDFVNDVIEETIVYEANVDKNLNIKISKVE